MGAWGYSVFENDDALDWVRDLHNSKSKLDFIKEILERLVKNSGYRDAPDCSKAIAAAAVVASIHDKSFDDLPSRIITWAQKQDKVDKSMLRLVRRAVKLVEIKSELCDLWKPSKDFKEC